MYWPKERLFNTLGHRKHPSLTISGPSGPDCDHTGKERPSAVGMKAVTSQAREYCGNENHTVSNLLFTDSFKKKAVNTTTTIPVKRSAVFIYI